MQVHIQLVESHPSAANTSGGARQKTSLSSLRDHPWLSSYLRPFFSHIIFWTAGRIGNNARQMNWRSLHRCGGGHFGRSTEVLWRSGGEDLRRVLVTKGERFLTKRRRSRTRRWRSAGGAWSAKRRRSGLMRTPNPQSTLDCYGNTYIHTYI